MTLPVFLADLRHDYTGIIANDCMPLGMAYMKAVMDREVPEVRSRVFAYCSDLMEAMRREPPAVLMLSNYCWNRELSLSMARMVKRIRPQTLVVMGGPNIPLEPERQKQFVERHPELDVYALGEGDFLAAELVRQFLECGAEARSMGGRAVPSSVYRRPDGSVESSGTRERTRNLEEIPSPWLGGVLDEFFDGKLAPIIETNRGCPFGCTFCSQGTGWYSKVNYFGMERLREEIFYIARRIQRHSPLMCTLRIADSNYGMYERDAEISSFLGETQRLYGWPTYIDATTGKNRPDRIIKSIEKVNGAMLLYQAVQSLDEEVLRKVKRTTIRTEAFEQVRMYVRGRGLRSNTDLILGLPGETLQSHLDGLRRVLDGGMSRITNFQLMMLKGTELETLEARAEFQFRTGFRVLPKNFGIYGDEMVFDIEEIVCATDTLPFEDYLAARRVALICGMLWFDTCFDDLYSYAASFGIKRSEWLDAIVARMQAAGGAVRELLAEFTRETKEELFDSHEECTEFYARPENFARLQRGEAGDNLLHKYRAIAMLHIWKETCGCVMEATRELLVPRGAVEAMPRFKEFWEELARFVEARQVHGRSRAEILAGRNARFEYDFPGWLASGAGKNVECFRVEGGVELEFRPEGDAASGLEEALDMWTDGLSGLTKMVARLQNGTLTCAGRVLQRERV